MVKEVFIPLLAQHRQGQLEQEIEHRRKDPQPGEPGKIHQGEENHPQKARRNPDALDQHHPMGADLGHALTAAVDEDQAEDADDQGQDHQEKIGLLKIALDAMERSAQHGSASFSFVWIIVPSPAGICNRGGEKLKKPSEKGFAFPPCRAILV